MRKIIILLLAIIYPVFGFANVTDHAVADAGTSSKISLYVPGFLFKVGSIFVDRHDAAETKQALRQLRSVSIVVRDGCAYREYAASCKYESKMNILKRQEFKPLLGVTREETNVVIQFKQNQKGTIRQLAVLVNDGAESFVFVRARCDISIQELRQWIQSESITKKLKLSN